MYYLLFIRVHIHGVHGGSSQSRNAQTTSSVSSGSTLRSSKASRETYPLQHVLALPWGLLSFSGVHESSLLQLAPFHLTFSTFKLPADVQILGNNNQPKHNSITSCTKDYNLIRDRTKTMHIRTNRSHIKYNIKNIISAFSPDTGVYQLQLHCQH